MKAYVVGGAVRDALLQRPVNDRDWVVVGATPAEMIAAGYTPVGADFPVFLHPQTHEEYALARTERKTAPGYKGFVFHTSPEVTLAEDLARRDLTINAMARDDDGALVDPFNGQRDLQQRVLRHVGEAFAEDPVRILRLARFAARFDDFTVAPETEALMQQMVTAGEVDALVPERVWQEVSRGLMESKPSRMFEVLRRCGALARLMPELDRLWGVPQPPAHHPEVDTGVHVMLVLDMAAQMAAPLTVRFACLCHDLGKGTTPPEEWPRHLAHEARSEDLARELALRLKAPTECSELAQLVAREHTNIHRATEFNARALMRLIERSDAFRRPQRFKEALQACEADARGRTGFQDRPYPSGPRLLKAVDAAMALPTKPIASGAMAKGAQGPAVAEAIRLARLQAVAQALDEHLDEG
ncbi:multifunctional CCA addition/repair protein [Ideonella azotifigens]|uniref:Multifunctional CCA protein n=1 Tax=Ideonella azotifigens TaxID=513160 RepID=A0ABP3VJA8_9BURK|nr:multifunctional CCA addition/repair protein [Ideonella azotifigens]MCD2339059.1 multifunctional CCA addition/repair protein [Ideonella azotifigens]